VFLNERQGQEEVYLLYRMAVGCISAHCTTAWTWRPRSSSRPGRTRAECSCCRGSPGQRPSW